MNNSNKNQNRIRINFQIRVPQVRLLDVDGNNLGIVETRDALKVAQDANLDLVEISPRVSPPVCKVMDYGKYKYDEKKAASVARKNQVTQELKEITFRPNTDDGDLKHKVEKAKEFLSEGNKVKFTVRHRGREIVHTDISKQKLAWIQEQLADLAQPNPFVNLEGKLLSMIVNPKK